MTDHELIIQYGKIYGGLAAAQLASALTKGTISKSAAMNAVLAVNKVPAPGALKKSANKLPAKPKVATNNINSSYLDKYVAADLEMSQKIDAILSAGTPVSAAVNNNPVPVEHNPSEISADADVGKWPPSETKVKSNTDNPFLSVFADPPVMKPPVGSGLGKMWVTHCKQGPTTLPKPGALFQWYIPTNFFCGIEYEVECVHSYTDKTVEGKSLLGELVNITEDNSLKFHGKEFITVPMNLDWHLLVYQALFSGGGIVFLHPDLVPPKESRFSSRTSTHVHVNMLALEQEQILALIWWYYLLEPLFFGMAHPSRASNIHCVQLKDTNMHKLLHKNSTLLGISESWHKYTAFNVKPLRQQGTIEFRHREGISSLESLKAWLEAIESWYQAVATRGLTVDKIKSLLRSGDSLRQAVQEYSPRLAFLADENALLEASIPLRLAMLRNF